ncbi:MAG: GOLPH3/VPS74 family protein [Promethearchaeota archaeon]
MLISEGLLLILLSEKKGRNYIYAWFRQDLLLAGALLMDLFIQNKILIDKSKVRLIDSTPNGVQFLDDIIEIWNLKLFKKERKREVGIKLKHMINFLSGRYRIYYLQIMRRLENQGILKIEEKKILKIFPLVGKFKRFYLVQLEIKQRLIEKIQTIIINNQEPDDYFLCLLNLLKESHLIRVYIPKGFRKQAKNRIDEAILSEKADIDIRNMIINIIETIIDIALAESTSGMG